MSACLATFRRLFPTAAADQGSRPDLAEEIIPERHPVLGPNPVTQQSGEEKGCELGESSGCRQLQPPVVPKAVDKPEAIPHADPSQD